MRTLRDKKYIRSVAAGGARVAEIGIFASSHIYMCMCIYVNIYI